MSELLRAIGIVLVVEGLVFALAPRRIEQAMAMLSMLSVDARRYLGLATLAVGVTLIALVGAYAR
ncbi:hypothetical protein U879_02765 [Defluviimonas sp. 20V17]|uniref:DUF2065 domain-containing protein n=1 Tax=Allgaiera indica TaxID=765699 RepID=A0AAN4UU87_9RHOB|nr:DUF2065 domain-containing protein [Allgaiera indica]KDB05185.1 hypothetical protein U879_02765 [Defluviimonas sp. 20V17]GHE05291.1 hypothetical protein GCM10008024_35490 [Allgaiera indica]SDX62705.1 hypothetical protein SAMN05444006_1228 [Allgaiera indica]